MTNLFKLRLTNHKNTVITFVLEPWGDVWPMAANAVYEIHFEIAGDTPANFPEVVLGDATITVYSGVSGHVIVYQNGHPIDSSSFNEAPLQKAA